MRDIKADQDIKAVEIAAMAASTTRLGPPFAALPWMDSEGLFHVSPWGVP